MDGKGTTVKELREYLEQMPDNALVFRAETVHDNPRGDFLMVLHVWEDNHAVMLD